MNNNLDDRLNMGIDVHQLKLGSSFTSSSNREVFHTIKYDFKPASVDTSKPAKLDVSSNSQVTVTVPHLDGSGVPNTVFKGPTREYSKKDCLLIINRETNEITLERLKCNVNVKKTRTEHTNKAPPPPKVLENNTQRQSSKTKVSTGARKTAISFVPKHSPLENSPSYPHKSPSTAPQWQPNNGLQTLPSIPIIGDYFEPIPSSKTATNSLPASLTQPSGSGTAVSQNTITNDLQNEIGVLSTSDSSSSGSDSTDDSGSDSDSDDNHPSPKPNAYSNGATFLNDDLRLSDSNSSDND